MADDGAGQVAEDPYLTPVEEQAEVRALVATDGLFTHRSLWCTSRAFATGRPAEPAAIAAGTWDAGEHALL